MSVFVGFGADCVPRLGWFPIGIGVETVSFCGFLVGVGMIFVGVWWVGVAVEVGAGVGFGVDVGRGADVDVGAGVGVAEGGRPIDMRHWLCRAA